MLKCPQCDNDEDFALDAVEYVTAYVTQHKTDTDWCNAADLELYDTKSESGTEWDDDTACRCLTCQYTAPLDTFEVSDYLWLIDASEA